MVFSIVTRYPPPPTTTIPPLPSAQGFAADASDFGAVFARFEAAAATGAMPESWVSQLLSVTADIDEASSEVGTGERSPLL